MKVISNPTCENLLNNLPGMFYRCKNDKDWTMEWVSAGCELVTGYNDSELIDNKIVSYRDLVHPEDRDWLWNICSVHLKKRESCNNEYRIICKRGRIRWVREVANGIYDNNGNLLYIEGFVQEITSERENILLSNAFDSYQGAINSGSIVSITNLKGEIIYCNDLFLKYSKFSKSELIGANHRIVNSGYHTSDFFAELWKTILGGKIWRGEIKNKDKEGEFYWVDTVISPVFDENRNIESFLSIRNIITDKKEKEQALIESEAFNKGILSSFLSNISVIDSEGLIISTNDAWKNFSKENGCSDLSMTSEGVNYFDVCKKSIENGDTIAAEALEGILSVVRQEKELFQYEYPCHSKTQLRWFLLSVTLHKSQINKAVVRHIDITKRKLMEQALLDSEYKYRSIIENSQELILTIEVDGTISFSNNAWKKKLGYNDVELIKMNFFDLLEKDSAKNCKSHFMKVLEGDSIYSVETILISKEGHKVFVDVNSSPLFLENKVIGVQCFLRDITSKKNAEIALKESEIRLEKVFESVQDVIYIISSDGKFVSLNSAFEKLSGYKIEDWIGRSFSEIVHPEDLPLAINSFKKVFNGEKVDVYDLRLRRKDGEYRICELTPGTLEYNGKIVGSLGVTRDITERKEAEIKLRESEERFNLALKGANDGLWDWNLATNDVYFSPRWKGMLGYEDSELPNSFDTWMSLIHPEDIGLTLLTLDNYLTGKSADYQLEFRLKHKKGHYVDVLARGFLIKDKNDTNVRITGTHLDMTELNVNKIQLQKLIDELSQKYNDLLQFNYIISHNLRTPVASILGLGSLLELSDNTEDEKEKIVNNIVLSTLKIDEVLRDLTNIISIRQPLSSKRITVRISEIVEGIVDMLKPEIEMSKVQIKLEIEESAETVCTIKSYVESVLYNLISNAIKYSSSKRTPIIIIKSIHRNGELILTIEDNGIGIDLAKNGENLFGLYKRFNSDSEGRGLGLFMSKNQVEAIGGKITICSELDKGTTFTITLPIG